MSDYVLSPDVVDAAGDLIRNEGDRCLVHICQLLDELSSMFGDRFRVSPETYGVLNLIEMLWDDPHIEQVPGTVCIEFAWNEKGRFDDVPATGLAAMLLRDSHPLSGQRRK